MNEATQCTGNSATREPKFQELLNQASGITSVIEHLKELHAILGVSYEEVARPDEQKKPNAPTLVSVLDELPNELAQAHAKIHDMISCIASQLN